MMPPVSGGGRRVGVVAGRGQISDSVFPYGSEGWGFEFLRARHVSAGQRVAGLTCGRGRSGMSVSWCEFLVRVQVPRLQALMSMRLV